jgi:hypothetical protein
MAILQDLLKRGAKGLAGGSLSMLGREGAMAGAAGMGMNYAARGMNWMANNPYARSALVGAGVGGVYGAFSDNTSVLGGMAMGAMAGAGGRGLFNAGKYGVGTYRNMRNMFGQGRGAALADTFSAMADKSKSLIGNTITKASNAFRAR